MRILSILGLVALAACNGGNDCNNCDGTGSDQDACADCSDDTGTDPAATGSFTAPKVAMPDGSLENCVSNLDEAFSVASGETKTGIPVGEYDMTFGSLDLATEYSDWLGVHTSSDGSQWVAPSELASIAKDSTLAPEPPAVSRYIGGQTWTCNDAGSEDESTAQTIVVSYIDGEELEIELGIGTFIINGNDLSFSEEGGCEDEGSFLNDSQIVINASCPFGDNSYQCWDGEFENRPTDW